MNKKLYQWRKNVEILNEKDNTLLKSKNIYTFLSHLKKFANKKYGPNLINSLYYIKKDSISSFLKKIMNKIDNKNNRL